MRPGPRLVVMVALAFISGAQSSTNYNQQQSIRGKLLSKKDESARYDETSPAAFTSLLSKVNPWLSACDLAQPKQAPDLQGSCTAGTLPVAWINEGPGPPQCPQSCQHNKYHVNDPNNQNTLKKDKNNKSTNNYNNNNNNFSSKPNNNNRNNNDINMENRLYENRQCLDYLGDNDEYSPSTICKKSSSDIDIETKLKSIRLRHCCERDVLSALHNEAYDEVLSRGPDCIPRLTELMNADILAARITCEFMEILVRYDCGHRYSLIHHCGDCKEMYRRWVCSTVFPYFATRNDTKTEPEPVSETDAALSNSNLMNNIDNKAQKMFKQTHSLEGSNEIKRSRRKVRPERRIRIRPCLSVCQTVEQKCPYMLPADRAPAYPTQYAGEPTFLCLDPNILETGNQLYKSNNGPEECCYEYCKNGDGLCSSSCAPIFISNHTAITPNNSTNRDRSKIQSTPKMFVILDDGSMVLNDYSNRPAESAMTCPVLPNITQSTQQCSISQAHAASSAKSHCRSPPPPILVLAGLCVCHLICYLAARLNEKPPQPYRGDIICLLALLLTTLLPLYVFERITYLEQALLYVGQSSTLLKSAIVNVLQSTPLLQQAEGL